jgi:hypothetical protein
MEKRHHHHTLPAIGWREWISLPDLGVEAIKAKIDTGARSSAIHAFNIHTFERNGVAMVGFHIHPYQRDSHKTVAAEAAILDRRHVRNSGGHAEERIAILTTACLQEEQWPIELTLTNRDLMGFRILLGRQAVRRRFLVNPGRSFLLSRN